MLLVCHDTPATAMLLYGACDPPICPFGETYPILLGGAAASNYTIIPERRADCSAGAAHDVANTQSGPVSCATLTATYKGSSTHREPSRPHAGDAGFPSSRGPIRLRRGAANPNYEITFVSGT
jgi:hypothetical protein